MSTTAVYDSFDRSKQGAAARDLHGNAVALLERLCGEGRLRARAVYGFWPAAGEGDDLVLYGDDARRREIARFPMLRQQQRKTDASPYLSLADFVAPRGAGVADHVGAFAVTAGIGLDALVREFEKHLLQESYVVPTIWWHRIIVLHKQLKGWNITPSHYVGQDLADVWLDE